MENEKEAYIIQKYRENEEMMILIYAQWCINNGIDPKNMYRQAYPNQQIPSLLKDAVTATVSKNESEEIAEEVVIQLLQMYGNDDLAFAIKVKTDATKNQKTENSSKENSGHD